MASDTSLANLPAEICALALAMASLGRTRYGELMTDAFALDPRLAADTLPVGDLALSLVLLMNDARHPWLILVPRRPGLVELTDLGESDAAALMAELRVATSVMLDLAKPDKVNVAALGNVVAQLHVHVVGRFMSDPAWPGPVWGRGQPTRYPPHAAAALVERARGLFASA